MPFLGLATIQDLNKLESKLAMKDTELKAALDAAKASTAKAFTELRAKIDELNTKIQALQDQIANADVPQDIADTALELKSLGQQLDDIVPDAAGATPPA